MSIVAQTLQKAKERVARGWCQNRGIDSRGNVCAGRAIYTGYQKVTGKTSIGEDQDYHTSCRYLMQAAQERTHFSWSTIPQWNDMRGRTQQEVLDTFDHAIKLAERDEGGDAA